MVRRQGELKVLKIMLIGADGMLGHDVAARLKETCELLPRIITDLDICDRENVRRDILTNKPDAVINCAAYTNVDGCEQDQKQAYAVNSEGPKNLAIACNEVGSRLFHISTDFIFAGNKNSSYVETDLPEPLSIYGKSKHEGEKQIQDILSEHVIIRTSWLFGKAGNNFVSTITRLSEEKDTLNIVNDQTGCPTHSIDLAQAIDLLLKKNSRGLYHFCNSGMCTWFEFAKEIISLLGRKTKVVPISSSELGRPAVRPVSSIMNCDKFTDETGFKPKSWKNALKEYLTNLQGA